MKCQECGSSMDDLMKLSKTCCNYSCNGYKCVGHWYGDRTKPHFYTTQQWKEIHDEMHTRVLHCNVCGKMWADNTSASICDCGRVITSIDLVSNDNVEFSERSEASER